MQTRLKIILILSIFVLAGPSVPVVQSATISVPDTAPTIKAAMIKAKAGDIILVACGTYYEHDILVKPGISLWSGTLQPSCVTIDSESKGRGLIFANADSTTSIVGITIMQGLANPEDQRGQGGGILCLNSKPKLSNCIIKYNRAEIGAGIYADEHSELDLTNCRLESNIATYTGGGIAFLGKRVNISESHFLDNMAISGGGLLIQNALSAHISNSHIIENIAGNSGGGILLMETDCFINGTIFSGNVGGLGGGGLAAFTSNPKLSRCTFYDNNSEKKGCAVACADSEVEINDSQLTFHPGPIMCAAGSTPLLSGCNIFGNTGGDWSGPLENQAYKRYNISAPPLYCGAESGDFHLSSSSASLPNNNPAGNKNIIGAYGIGCSLVAANETKFNRLADGGSF